MRIRFQWLLGAMIALSSLSAWAQLHPAATPAPDPAAQQTPAPVEGVMLPDQKFEQVRLDDILDFLKDKIPGFNSVVVRGPGVPDDYPTIPTLTAKNVTVGQFLEFLKSSYPGVEIQRIDGPAAPLYVIRVGSASFNPGLFGGPPGVGGGGVPLPGDGPTQIQIYRLSDIVTSIAATKTDNGDHAKEALDDVLSLIQSSMEQTDEKVPPTMKIHPATQTLLFKGNRAQIVVIQQVLEALQPTPDDLKNIKNAQVGNTNLENSLKLTVSTLAAEREEKALLTHENAELEKKLEALQSSTTKPTK
jgi:hypothetical protein